MPSECFLKSCLSMCFCICLIASSWSLVYGFLLSMNVRGIGSSVPVIIVKGDIPFLLGIVLIARQIKGRAINHSSFLSFIAVFIALCILSIIPFDLAWKGVVLGL